MNLSYLHRICVPLYSSSITTTSSCRDNVEWDEEQEEAATQAIQKQQQAPITPEEQGGCGVRGRRILRYALVVSSQFATIPVPLSPS